MECGISSESLWFPTNFCRLLLLLQYLFTSSSLFDLVDVATAHPDKKSVMIYVTSLFQVLPHGVSMEAIQEVETLPRTVVTKEEHFHFETQQRFSQQVSSKKSEN